MLKRGQVTVFIIVGIILLVISAITVLLVRTTTTENVEAQQQGYSSVFVPVRSFVSSCLEQTSIKGLRYLGFRGGYYKVPEQAENLIFLHIPYYFDVGEKNVPSKKEVSQQLALYIEDNLDDCLKDFTNFKDAGLLFSDAQPTVKVGLDSRVIVNLNYPFSVTSGEEVFQPKEFLATIPFNFNYVYDVLNETVSAQEKDLNFVPLGQMTASSKDEGNSFELIYREGDVVIYSFIFNQELLDREQYVFTFASRYDWSKYSAESELNYTWDLEEQRCYVGDLCLIDLNIYNEPVQFTSYTDLFGVSSSGLIEFFPDESNLGNNSVLIKVHDVQGNEEYNVLDLEIATYLDDLRIKTILPQKADVGENFTYQLELENELEGVTFSSDSELFEISLKGLISFVPVEEQAGDYIIEITAVSGELTVTETLHLTVGETEEYSLQELLDLPEGEIDPEPPYDEE